jgi:hypothetical protein
MTNFADVSPLLTAFAMDIMGCSEPEAESLVHEFWNEGEPCKYTGIHERTEESRPNCRWCNIPLVSDYGG